MRTPVAGGGRGVASPAGAERMKGLRTLSDEIVGNIDTVLLIPARGAGMDGDAGGEHVFRAGVAGILVNAFEGVEMAEEGVDELVGQIVVERLMTDEQVQRVCDILKGSLK